MEEEEMKNEQMPEEKVTAVEEKTEAKKPELSDAQANKWWGVLCYLGVLVVIPLIQKKASPFVEFHTKQGLVLLIGWAISWLPFGPIIGILALVFSVMGIINALSGEMKRLPLVGELAEKINL
jgi:uncharacterized membrane protein